MGKIITCGLQKGGSAKSSTAQAMADIYGSQGKHVLLIDLDPQRNTSYTEQVVSPDNSITDVLYGNCTADEAIITCKYHDLIASDTYLTNIQTALIDTSVPASAKSDLSAAGYLIISLTLLRDKLQSIKPKYDLIIIDIPPSLGNLSLMALIASDFIVIPSEASAFALAGLFDLIKTVKAVTNSYNPSLEVAGVLLTRYDKRTTLSSDIHQILQAHREDMGFRLFESTIRNSVDVQKAQMAQMPLIDYAPRNKATADYIAFCKELSDKIGV